MIAVPYHRLCRCGAGGHRLRHLRAVARQELKGGALLAAAIALFLLGMGGGTYWMLGQPDLAWRAAAGHDDPRRQRPDPLSDRAGAQGAGRSAGLGLSGRAPICGAGDADDAAKAYGRAVTLARLAAIAGRRPGSAYGEALVRGQWRGQRRSRSRLPMPR